MGVDAQAQRVIFGVGKFRRVVQVIRPVVALDLERQPLVLYLGLGLGELIHVAAGTSKTMVEAIGRSTMAALSASGLAKWPPGQAPNCEVLRSEKNPGECGAHERFRHPTGKSPALFGAALSSPFCKNILIFRRTKSVHIAAVPSHTEGRCATSRNAERDAVDADGAADDST
jgi:hypothetical protein